MLDSSANFRSPSSFCCFFTDPHSLVAQAVECETGESNAQATLLPENKAKNRYVNILACNFPFTLGPGTF